MSAALSIDLADVRELLDALKSTEWAHMTWTDYPSCPFCGELQEDGAKHAPDCEWFALMVKWNRRSKYE